MLLGGAVGWGTELQAGMWRIRFPIEWLGFFIDLMLLAALWALRLTQPLEKNEYQDYFLGIKTAGA
jgi:hypothetical protein